MAGNPFEPEQSELCSRPALRPVKTTKVLPGSVCAYDKLTSRLLGVFDSVSAAAGHYGLCHNTVKSQCESLGFGRGWVAFRFGYEPLWDSVGGSTNRPVVIADDGLRVAFSSVAAAAEAMGCDYQRLYDKIINGKRFDYCGRECIGMRLHGSVGGAVVTQDEAFSMLERGEDLGSTVIRWGGLHG